MRFQEILEHQFNGAINEDVLDMFNVRYLISKDQQTMWIVFKDVRQQQEMLGLWIR